MRTTIKEGRKSEKSKTRRASVGAGLPANAVHQALRGATFASKPAPTGKGLTHRYPGMAPMMDFQVILYRAQHPGFLLMNEEVPACEHVQREAAQGFLAPADQLFGGSAVVLATEHVDRALEQRAFDRSKTPAQQKVGAQDWQGQAHQFFVAQHLFAGALQAA
ncbi:hypothetical protein D3C85_1281230 [compost metagenome]